MNLDFTKLVEELHNWRVRIGTLITNFKNRDGEVKKLINDVLDGGVYLIHAPKRFGKTELAKALIYALSFQENVQALYLTLKGNEVIFAKFGRLKFYRRETLIECLSFIKDYLNKQGVRRALIFVDNVTSNNFKIFKDLMKLLIDTQHIISVIAIADSHVLKQSMMNYFLKTYCLWSIDENSWSELFKELRINEDLEFVKKLVGACIGELGIIQQYFGGNVSRWIQHKYHQLSEIYDKYLSKKKSEYIEIFRELIADVDKVEQYEDSNLCRELISRGIIVKLSGEVIGEKLEVFGEKYTWSLPVNKYLFEILVREGKVSSVELYRYLKRLV